MVSNKNLLKVISIFFIVSFLYSCSSDPEIIEPQPDDSSEEQKPSDDSCEQPSDIPSDNPGEEPSFTPEYPYKFYAGKMEIITDGGKKITSKETYIDCSISLDHFNAEWEFENVEAEIRGRGNSSWKWYEKKPYRIKFRKKQSVMGLQEAKSWVLLAEYRDPTDLMNSFVFELGQSAGIPFTNHNRYVEVVLNDEYIGLYHLTEQVQQNKARVNIDEEKGCLIELDADDGPELSPRALDNFWSSVYYMPVCIKNPENLDDNLKSSIKSDLGELEKDIYNFNWIKIQEKLDVKSMADFLIVQELVYNVELDAPRSMYMYKDIGGKWTMGPLWDFDGGFDFDWGSMYTGHSFFNNYKELILGSNPFTHQGTQYRIPGFFSDLFNISEFKELYQERWKEISKMVQSAWNITKTYYEANPDAYEREAVRWPIDKNYNKEIERMDSWLINRVEYLNEIISEY